MQVTRRVRERLPVFAEAGRVTVKKLKGEIIVPTILIWVTIISTFLICLAVWRLLVSALKNTSLETKTKKLFTTASAAYLFGWWILMFALAGVRVFAASPDSVVPSITIALGVLLPLIIGLVFLQTSPTLKTAVNAIPNHLLLNVQFYRVLGVIFVALYLLDKLPAEFALPAGVGDIIVGVAAPIVGYFLAKNYRRSRNAAIVWNVFGILDLVVAVACGFLTSPGPFQSLATENPNHLITALPLVLVPVFAVPLSILLHVVSLKRLKDSPQTINFRGNGWLALASSNR